jgi:hypothetical protein
MSGCARKRIRAVADELEVPSLRFGSVYLFKLVVGTDDTGKGSRVVAVTEINCGVEPE